LNGNRLVFVNGSKWVVETSDLDVAANEMDKILDEREELEASLEEARAHIDALNKEIIETNEMKNAALGMVG
jgi:predicted nuclease with TOPRIM domain